MKLRTAVATLDVIDLDGSDEAVYETIVAHQPASLDELRAHSGVAGPDLVQAVDRLEAKGLIGRASDDPQRLIAWPPDVALEALLMQREERIAQARLQVARLAAIHQGKAPSSDHPTSVLELVSGRDAVLQRFTQLQQTCRTELRVIDKPPYAATDPDCNIAIEEELATRGVRVRAIYDPSGFASFHQLRGDVQASISAGVQARTLPEAPIKLVLADNRLAMLPLYAGDEVDSMVVVRPSVLLDALSALFEELWDRSLVLGLPDDDQPSAPSQVPTEEERRLLSLLTAGLSDEAIGRHLGISHRTMQRRMSALLKRLGATTRFQAGLRAIARDWLPIPPASHR